MTGLTGRKLGQYEVLEKIGHGGMANVYRGLQSSIGREVAIKVLPAYFLQDPTFLERFAREVTIIAQLQHPRILPVYDFGEESGTPFIVMAYMPGGTLADRILEAQGGLPLDDVARYVIQIAEALDFAHEMGIIHRDFKPSNVLLDRKDNAYLADFGIAKVTEATAQLTGSGVVGTPAYMAPEMTRRGGVTPLVDVYALGITLFQMLTGQLPYEADTPMGTALAHVTNPIPDARGLRPDLSDTAQSIIERAMAKDPVDRYQSAGELAADVSAAALPIPREAAPEPDMATPSPYDQPAAPSPPDAVTMDVEGAAPAEDMYPIVDAPTVDRAAAWIPPEPTAKPAPTAPPAGELQPGTRRLPGWVWIAGLGAVAAVVLAMVFWPRGGSESARQEEPAAADGESAEEGPSPEPAEEPPTATVTAAATNTPTPTEEPTNTPEPFRPALAPSDCSAAGLPETACTGVTRNADWAPITQEVGGVTMALVPAGCFMMGSEDGDDDERPVHQVCFERPFWIDVYEVTNGQYGSSGQWSEDDRPRERVVWDEAIAHCVLRGARLPTEAEWEYAARGPDGLVYPWGNEFVADHVVYSANALNITAAVGSRPEGVSWVGAYDMIGNVWEWVADWYGAYPSGAQVDPSGPGSGEYRELRGGGWDSIADYLRSANRGGFNPGPSNWSVGFRCARSYAP